MVGLLPMLAAHFDRLQDRMASFTKNGVQVESWFKAELMLLFDTAVASGHLGSLDREVKVDAGQIDFVLETTNGKRIWIELKHWLIGKQKGTSYNAAYYFNDGGGIRKDIAKLRTVSPLDERVLLIFATSSPTVEEWTNGVSLFNKKYAPLSIASLTTPSKDTAHYFLGLLKIP